MLMKASEGGGGRLRRQALDPRPLFEALVLLSAGEGRVRVIDGARGLFVAWMIVAHALTLAGIGDQHPLQWLRPRGWATTCFVTLTGFSLGVLVEWSPAGGAVWARRLWRRALQIGAAAYLSNLLSGSLVAALEGRLSARYLPRLLAGGEPWSISAILLPTSLFLAASPAVLRAAARTSPGRLFGLVTAGLCVLDAAQRLAPATGWAGEVNAWLFRSGGPFQFPILLYSLYAVWGLALGRLLRARRGAPASWGLLLAGAAGLTALRAPLEAAFALHVPSLQVASRFVLGLQIAALLQWAERRVPVNRFLSAMGQGALLVFLLHRPLLHVLHRLLHGVQPPAGRALLVIASTLAASYLIAAGRQRHPRLAAALRRYGL